MSCRSFHPHGPALGNIGRYVVGNFLFCIVLTGLYSFHSGAARNPVSSQPGEEYANGAVFLTTSRYLFYIDLIQYNFIFYLFLLHEVRATVCSIVPLSCIVVVLRLAMVYYMSLQITATQLR